jgi:hypothetical protein
VGDKRLTDRALVATVVRVYGYRRAVELIGWATLAGVSGDASARGLLRLSVGSRATRYRVVADMRGLADALRAEGYDLGTDELVQAVASVRAVA